MLKRVTGALFEGDADSDVQLVVQAQNNIGTESAKFEYDSTVLPARPIQGHPGCKFTVEASIRQFEVIVVFAPGAPSSARYDLFEVNSAGGLSPLGEFVTKAASAPLIGFGIDGLPVAAIAPRGMAPRARRAGARKAAARRRTAAPRTRKAAGKTTAAKKRKTAAKKRKSAVKRAQPRKRSKPRAARSRKR